MPCGGFIFNQVNQVNQVLNYFSGKSGANLLKF